MSGDWDIDRKYRWAWRVLTALVLAGSYVGFLLWEGTTGRWSRFGFAMMVVSVGAAFVAQVPRLMKVRREPVVRG